MLPEGKAFVVQGSVGPPYEQVTWVVCGFSSQEAAQDYAVVCREAVAKARAAVVSMLDFHELHHPEIQKLLDELRVVDPWVGSEEKCLPISWNSTPTYEAVKIPWGE